MALGEARVPSLVPGSIAWPVVHVCHLPPSFSGAQNTHCSNGLTVEYTHLNHVHGYLSGSRHEHTDQEHDTERDWHGDGIHFPLEMMQ